MLLEFQQIQLLEQERVKKLGQVRPEISGDFHGYKFVAVGSKLDLLAQRQNYISSQTCSSPMFLKRSDVIGSHRKLRSLPMSDTP